MGKLVITPKTKIQDLLVAYPALEEVLIELAPPFQKLKNPVLRKTIARVTSLSQAASVGGIAVETLTDKTLGLGHKHWVDRRGEYYHLFFTRSINER
jgi:hypothetical protein